MSSAEGESVEMSPQVKVGFHLIVSPSAEVALSFTDRRTSRPGKSVTAAEDSAARMAVLGLNSSREGLVDIYAGHRHH